MISNTAVWWLCVVCGMSLGILFYLLIAKLFLWPGYDGGMIIEEDYYDPTDDFDYDLCRANIEELIDYYFEQRAQDDDNQIDYVKRWWGE